MGRRGRGTCTVCGALAPEVAVDASARQAVAARDDQGASMSYTTCDLLDAHPELEACEAGLVHYGGTQRFFGPAVTLRCYEDNSVLRELVHTPGARRVLVVDGGLSRRCALLGDLLATAAHTHGWAGLVIGGCVRDSVQLRAVPIGILALGVQPRRSSKHGQGIAGVPVELLGARVHPGDCVYADADGVVFSKTPLG
jgi:regulator of ribonuclease activity A